MIVSRINKRMYLCLFEHANTRKHANEHNCSSVFLSDLAHLAQSFYLILNAINELVFLYATVLNIVLTTVFYFICLNWVRTKG